MKWKCIQPSIVFVTGLLLIVSCQGQGVKATKLDPNGFERMLNSTPDEILIDVRTPDEYAEGHLSNAILINLLGDDFSLQINKLDRSRPVFVYCNSGARSSKAARALVQAGFNSIYDLEGGIIAWSDADKKIVK